MTVGRNKAVRGVVSKALDTVVQHISVEVVAYGISVKYRQTVVDIVSKAAVRRIGDIARCIVVEGLGRYNRVITELLDRSRSYSAEIIISITHFGTICKYYVMKNSRTRKCG